MKPSYFFECLFGQMLVGDICFSEFVGKSFFF